MLHLGQNECSYMFLNNLLSQATNALCSIIFLTSLFVIWEVADGWSEQQPLLP